MKNAVLPVQQLPIFKDHALNQILFRNRALINSDNEDLVKHYAKQTPNLGVNSIIAANLAAELVRNKEFSELDFGQELAIWRGLVQSNINRVKRDGSLDDSYTAALVTVTAKEIDVILSDKQRLKRITVGSELMEEKEVRSALKSFYSWTKGFVKDLVNPLA